MKASVSRSPEAGFILDFMGVDAAPVVEGVAVAERDFVDIVTSDYPSEVTAEQASALQQMKSYAELMGVDAGSAVMRELGDAMRLPIQGAHISSDAPAPLLDVAAVEEENRVLRLSYATIQADMVKMSQQLADSFDARAVLERAQTMSSSPLRAAANSGAEVKEGGEESPSSEADELDRRNNQLRIEAFKLQHASQLAWIDACSRKLDPVGSKRWEAVKRIIINPAFSMRDFKNSSAFTKEELEEVQLAKRFLADKTAWGDYVRLATVEQGLKAIPELATRAILKGEATIGSQRQLELARAYLLKLDAMKKGDVSAMEQVTALLALKCPKTFEVAAPSGKSVQSGRTLKHRRSEEASAAVAPPPENPSRQVEAVVAEIQEFGSTQAALFRLQQELTEQNAQMVMPQAELTQISDEFATIRREGVARWNPQLHAQVGAQIEASQILIVGCVAQLHQATQKTAAVRKPCSVERFFWVSFFTGRSFSVGGSLLRPAAAG